MSWCNPFQWKLYIFFIFCTIVITFRLIVISDEGAKSQLTNYLNKIATMNHICNDWQCNICLYYVKQINFLNCKYINLDEVICKWYAERFRTKKIIPLRGITLAKTVYLIHFPANGQNELRYCLNIPFNANFEAPFNISPISPLKRLVYKFGNHAKSKFQTEAKKQVNIELI